MKKSGKEIENVCEANELCAHQKFLNDLKEVNSSYIKILIISGALISAGIAVAVLWNVFVGLCVAMAAVLLYMLMTKRLLDKRLGLSYFSMTGSLAITAVRSKGRDEIFIPSVLILTPVTELGTKAFSQENSSCIKSVHLPASLTEIGTDVFDGCTSLKTIYFEGSESDWESIECNSDLSSYEIIFNDPLDYQVKKEERSIEVSKADTEEENENNVANDEDR